MFIIIIFIYTANNILYNYFIVSVLKELEYISIFAVNNGITKNVIKNNIP